MFPFILFLLILIYQYIDAVVSVAFSAFVKYLANGSWDKTANLIDIQSKKIYHKFDNLHTGNYLLYIYVSIIVKKISFIQKIILIYIYIYVIYIHKFIQTTGEWYFLTWMSMTQIFLKELKW